MSAEVQHDKIAVIDFGGQYAHLIATKVRRSHVLAEIRQPEDPIEDFLELPGHHPLRQPRPQLLRGGFGLHQGNLRPRYSHPGLLLRPPGNRQALRRHRGQRQAGVGPCRPAHPAHEHPLFAGLDQVEQVWMSHFDSVTAVGPDFEELGYTLLGEGSAPHRFAAIGSDKLRRYGFQYHPEVDDTLHGDEMIANFVLNICGCRPTWTMDSYVEEQVQKIRDQVGDELGVPAGQRRRGQHGGRQAVRRGPGPRPPEPAARGQRPDAQGRDRRPWSRCSPSWAWARTSISSTPPTPSSPPSRARSSPRQKRRAIGNTFIEVFESEARRLGIEDHLLGQGTIYPDTIETGGTKRADTIKTHHNRVPIIEEMIAGRQGHRAAGRPVQGRGARAGREAGDSPRHDLAPPLPGPRPGCAPAVCRWSGVRCRAAGRASGLPSTRPWKSTA